MIRLLGPRSSAWAFQRPSLALLEQAVYGALVHGQLIREQGSDVHGLYAHDENKF